jgi:hypothetical protein
MPAVFRTPRFAHARCVSHTLFRARPMCFAHPVSRPPPVFRTPCFVQARCVSHTLFRACPLCFAHLVSRTCFAPPALDPLCFTPGFAPPVSHHPLWTRCVSQGKQEKQDDSSLEGTPVQSLPQELAGAGPFEESPLYGWTTWEVLDTASAVNLGKSIKEWPKDIVVVKAFPLADGGFEWYKGDINFAARTAKTHFWVIYEDAECKSKYAPGDQYGKLWHFCRVQECEP